VDADCLRCIDYPDMDIKPRPTIPGGVPAGARGDGIAAAVFVVRRQLPALLHRLGKFLSRFYRFWHARAWLSPVPGDDGAGGVVVHHSYRQAGNGTDRRDSRWHYYGRAGVSQRLAVVAVAVPFLSGFAEHLVLLDQLR